MTQSDRPRHETRVRLAALERARRRNSAGLAVLALVGAAAVAMGQAKPPVDEVRAKRFVVVDAEGKERARIEVGSDGAAQLVLRDGKGNAAVTLSAAGAGGGALQLKQGEADVKLELNAESKDPTRPWAFLSMFREPTAVGLGILPGGHAQLNLSANRRSRVHMGVTPGGGTKGWVKDAKGNVLWDANE